MSSNEGSRTFRPDTANLRFYEGFLWAVAAAGLALLAWGILAPQPGRAPLGARLILWGVLVLATGPMMFFGARAALKYRRLRQSGLAGSMVIRLTDAALQITTMTGDTRYPWTAFARVAPDTDFTAVGPFRQGSVGALVLQRKAAPAPGRIALSRGVARGHFLPVETDGMVLVPLRFFHTPNARALVAAAVTLHRQATTNESPAYG